MSNTFAQQLRYGQLWLIRNGFYRDRMKVTELLVEHYPGGFSSFQKEFRQTLEMSTRLDLISTARTLLELDEEERDEKLAIIAQETENPIAVEKLVALTDDLLETRRECQDALAQANRFAESFDEDDIDRLTRLVEDPFISSWIEEEFGVSTNAVHKVEALAVNNYGALVINTTRVPCIDVDTRSRTKVVRLLDELGTMGFGGRLYQTAKGYRVVLAQEVMAERLFAELLPRWRVRGIDPSYCQVSLFLGSYRARLTAKPWRVVDGARNLGRGYDHYPVSCFLETFGHTECDHPEHFRRVMEIHDRTAITNHKHTLY